MKRSVRYQEPINPAKRTGHGRFDVYLIKGYGVLWSRGDLRVRMKYIYISPGFKNLDKRISSSDTAFDIFL